MAKYKYLMMGRIKPTSCGDTIVEVLIAIAIASFAIGISYATAQRSLEQAITARERNEALNIMENQLADLKLRFQNTTTDSFNLNFATKTNYCLLDSASNPSASNWQPYFNGGPNGPPSQTAPLALSTDMPQGPYNPACKGQRAGDGVAYYYDITTTQASGALVNPTLYQVTVRWERIGGGQTNQASLFYKLNTIRPQVVTAAPSPPPAPPPPPAPSAPSVTLTANAGQFGLEFNSAGPIPGMTCLQISEPADNSGTWYDNYLCWPTNENLGLTWNAAGPTNAGITTINGATCMNTYEGADPDYWYDNYLCSPRNYGLRWSSAGPLANMYCTKWDESADYAQTWYDNYSCEPTYNTVKLSWISSGATSCTTSWGGGGTGTSGSDLQFGLTSSTTYTVTCTGPGGAGSSSRMVNVGPTDSEPACQGAYCTHGR